MDIVPLDPACPSCQGNVDHEGGFDGTEADCASCGAPVVLVVFEDLARWMPADEEE